MYGTLKSVIWRMMKIRKCRPTCVCIKYVRTRMNIIFFAYVPLSYLLVRLEENDIHFPELEGKFVENPRINYV